MRKLDIDKWNRKEHFNFFNQFLDPYFSVCVQLDVLKAYDLSKKKKLPFFAVFLYACMKAINKVENFKYRIEDEQVFIYDTIHASATFLRANNTFGFSFIHFDTDLEVFCDNYNKEKLRILNSNNLFPPINSQDCIYCSTLPWVDFSGHKEPLFGHKKESVPKLAFGKYQPLNGALIMPVSIAVNHALMDGYHLGLFVEHFKKELSYF